MCPLHRSTCAPNHMIINVSPLEFGNSLLVPSANSQLPQVRSFLSLIAYITRLFTVPLFPPEIPAARGLRSLEGKEGLFTV